MKKSASSKSRSERYGSRCVALFVISGMMITMLILLNGCLFCDKSTTFVDDSKRVALLEPNEPAPFKGVLVTEGRYEYFLDCEGVILERGILP